VVAVLALGHRCLRTMFWLSPLFCALQPTPSGLPYDPNMSQAENRSTSHPANEFRNKHARYFFFAQISD